MIKCKLSRSVSPLVLGVTLIASLFLSLLILPVKPTLAAEPLTFVSVGMMRGASVISLTNTGTPSPTNSIEEGSPLWISRDIGSLAVEFSLSKIAFPISGATVKAGGKITYTLRITNTGNMTANNVVITDILPAEVKLLTSTVSRGEIQTADPTIIWEIDRLKANQSANATLVVTVENITQATAIVNRFRIDSQQTAPDFSNQVVHQLVPLSAVYLPFILRIPPPPTFVNPGFEASPDTAWGESSTNFPSLIVTVADLPSPVKPRSGNRVAWLGGRANERSVLSQKVTLGKGFPGLYLTYYYWLASQESSCGNDIFQVKANTQVIFTQNLCNANGTNGWRKHILNLAAYQNKEVTFEFVVQLNGSLNSNLFLDDLGFDYAVSGAANLSSTPPGQAGAGERP